jgi:hypothetical protein
MEIAALRGLRLWLDKAGPDKELLQAAQHVLEGHRRQWPSPATSIQATYFVYLNAVPDEDRISRPIGMLLQAAHDVPWEKQRDQRIVQAMFKGRLEGIGKPPVMNFQEWLNKEYRGNRAEVQRAWRTWMAARYGLPPKEGPGSEISINQWGDWVGAFVDRHSRFLNDLGEFPSGVENCDATPFTATELLVALARYQADHERPPAKLTDLVPGYLSKLPGDDAGGFQYAIAVGGEEVYSDVPPTKLLPGQAYITSPFLVRYPVPVWPKKNN